MIYIKKIFNQDIKNQIAVTKDPSLYFFHQKTNDGEERDILFHYYSLDDAVSYPPINASIKGYGVECRINGDFKGFIKKNFKLEEGDIIAFKDKSKDEFFFAYIKKNNTTRDIHRVFEIFDDNHCLYDDSNTALNKTDLDYLSRNRIIFGAPGTGKSHKLQEDVEKYFSATINYESLLKEEIQNRPQDADKEPWFNHIGIKYASYIYKLSYEKTEPELQELWGISQNELWKMKTAARACIDYKHSVLNNSAESFTTYERVTFHPNYSYAQFVGTYKPIIKVVGDKEEISYEYVPGPFIRTFINSKKTGQNVLLLIEEINRANVAAVFGDVFQLLDRKSDGTSEYPITTSEDLRKYLAKPENLGGSPDDYKTISIPSNMYIWATMNSADQGVMPMDAAFKRRWDFEYIGIDDALINEDGSDNIVKKICIPISEDGKRQINWNEFRQKLNEKLTTSVKVNEDKLLGPFFLSLTSLEKAKDEPKTFVKLFKSKVLMYLFEDVVKMNPKKLFSNCGEDLRYSKICEQWEINGPAIFNIDCKILTSETASEK